MIDLSNGAVGRIAGNVFVNGIGKENYGTMIAVAPEGAENRSAGLVIENNDVSLAPGFPLAHRLRRRLERRAARDPRQPAGPADRLFERR